MSKLLKPIYLKELCKQYNLTPSKNYGQNYLVSEDPVEKMIRAGELNRNDTVIEIGPGFGVLTFALAQKVKKVIAFEIEKRLKQYWEEKQKVFGNIQIVWGNALKQISSFHFPAAAGFKVLANLPYQITSNAIRTLLELENKPERIIIMVQKEVAERICANPGNMSLLSVSVRYYGEPKIISKISKENFWPKPKVDSAIISIGNISERKDKEKFFKIARVGFANKRKQLYRNISSGLKLDPEKVKNTLRKVVGDEKARAQDLSVEQWVEVVELLGV